MDFLDDRVVAFFDGVPFVFSAIVVESCTPRASITAIILFRVGLPSPLKER